MKIKEEVILVNHLGKKVGIAEKLQAHQDGLLHRAFSIFIFNGRNEMLLQKRASGKYHFAGLWSNACCSHPRDGERMLSAARRRLREELNMETTLESQGSVTYKFHDLKSGLTEHELDYIFTGIFDGEISFNPAEVEAVWWISLPQLKKEMTAFPEKFTPWFIYIMNELVTFQTFSKTNR
jgi:isopentenyl-diphosphate delta-isomerase